MLTMNTQTKYLEKYYDKLLDAKFNYFITQNLIWPNIGISDAYTTLISAVTLQMWLSTTSTVTKYNNHKEFYKVMYKDN